MVSLGASLTLEHLLLSYVDCAVHPDMVYCPKYTISEAIPLCGIFGAFSDILVCQGGILILTLFADFLTGTI